MNAIEQLPNVREYIKISQENGNIQFDDGSSIPDVTAHWVGLDFGRVLWKKGKNTPVCKSTDGATPCGGTDVQCETCEECPKKDWIDNQRPECNAVYSMLLLLLPDLRPVVLQISGAAVPSLSKLSQRLKFYKNNPTIKISGQAKTYSGQRSYWIPVFAVEGGELISMSEIALSAPKPPAQIPVLDDLPF